MRKNNKCQLNPIIGFFSYKETYPDKAHASKIKVILEKYGIDVFLAHDDIKVTKEWDDEVIKNLKQCDFVLLLLTENFRQSDYTDQETGIAIGLDKEIIPIKVDTDPYGFIDKKQALKLNLNDMEKSCLEIIQLIKDESNLEEKINNSLIIGIIKSKNFIECNLKCKLLPPLNKLKKKQITSLVNDGIENPQFYNSTEGIRILDEIEKKYSHFLKEETFEKIYKIRGKEIEKSKLRILPGFVFRKKKPAVFGIEILAGILRSHAQIKKEDGKYIGKIKNIEKEGKIITEAKRGDKVAVSMEEPTIGRQINEGDILIAYY